jgi:hypothetical protein
VVASRGLTPPARPAPLERSVLRVVPLSAAPRHPLLPAPGTEVWLTDDDRELAGAVERRLRALGLRPRLVCCAGLAESPAPAALGGLLILAPATAVSDSWLRDAVLGLRDLGPALRQGRGAFATASRLDGAFGLVGLDARREPLDGGLAGLAKTAGHEWPEVACKALDLAGDFATPEEAAAALVEELFLAGPAEVGLARAGRVTLARVAQPLSGGTGAAPFLPGEVVVLSGGARGVTAAVRSRPPSPDGWPG